MIKKIYLTCIFVASLLSVIVFATESDNSAIRLPAITSYWKADDAVKNATISMEEIDKCIGNDMKIRQQYNAYKEGSDKLSTESATLEKEIQKLLPVRDALLAESALINAEIAALNDKDLALEKDRVEINALSTKKLDSAGAKSANVKINAFNARVNQLNVERISLKGKVESFAEKQAEFSKVASRLQERSDAYNAKIVQFKTQEADFEAMMASYREKCTGKREIICTSFDVI